MAALSLCTGCKDDDPTTEPEVPVTPDTPETPENPDKDKTAYTDEKAYANFFAFNMMDDVYLWKSEIASSLKNWQLSEDPITKVKSVRYKENGSDVDKWTMMTNQFSSLINNMSGSVNTTYGFDFQPYLRESGSTAALAFVLYTYPGSPAEKAGLKRGDLILQVDGEDMNTTNYTKLYQSSSVTLGLGKVENKQYVLTGETVAMTAIAMYEDPVLIDSIYNCNGKKVGYLMYNSFTLASCERLVEVAKRFKQAGVSELILDMRYNGGGYVFTENVLASLLAPENEVKNSALYQTEIWNNDYMEYFQKNNIELNTYFQTEFKGKDANGTVYNVNTADANIGLQQIYALVAGGTASASESILTGLLPMMNISIIGEQTHGKYCTGMLKAGSEWFEDVEEAYTEAKMSFKEEFPEYAKWKDYINDWGIYVMINRYADRNGNTPCMPDGFKPDLAVEDCFDEPYPLGDDREAMLRAALQLAGKTDLTPRASTRTLTANALRSGRKVEFRHQPLDGKRIYTGKLPLPRKPLTTECPTKATSALR